MHVVDTYTQSVFRFWYGILLIYTLPIYHYITHDLLQSYN